MAKFMVFWRANLNAPWPIDPVERTKAHEMLFAGIDSLIKTGEILEFGYFQDGLSGYAITTGESKDLFTGSFSFLPWIVSEPHEIVPYETAKEAMRGVLKAL